MRRQAPLRAFGLALLLGLALPLRTALAQPDPQFEAQLDGLIQLAYEQPALAQQQLQMLRSGPQGRLPEHAALLDLTEGRLLVQLSEAPAALVVAARLEQRPGERDRARLLRAQVAEQQGKSSEVMTLAQQSLQGLLPPCRTGPGSPKLPPACDYRSAWQALYLVYRGQQAQGSNALALSTARQALQVAEIGQDRDRRILTLGDMALLALELDQREDVRRWLAAGEALAEGQPLPMARIKIYEALVGARRGDRAAQQRAFQEALDFASQADAHHLQAKIRTNLIDLYLHTDRPALAVPLARQALPVLQRYKDQRFERLLRHNLGVALILLKQFDAARRELAAARQLGAGLPADPAQRARALREVGEALASAGQAREAIAAFHEERRLSAEIQERSRAALLEQLKLKYDSEGEQRDLELLTRDKTLKDQQLANRDLARHVGIALGVLLGLSLLLVAAMLRRVRAANRHLKANELLLRAQSERDPLTELANRRHFLAVMQQHAKERFEGALLMVDIDHFKHVNDRHGHASGDQVIREVARRIGEAVRDEDLVVRWGGEEFLVYSPGVAQDQLRLLAERILFSVGAEPVAVENGALAVSVSIGYACFPLPQGRLQLHWEQAVNWADMALYMAKAQGRNRAVGIASVVAGDNSALQAIETDFDAACSAHRVSLHHILGPQPA